MGLIGYARISTVEGAQVLDRQLDARISVPPRPARWCICTC